MNKVIGRLTGTEYFTGTYAECCDYVLKRKYTLAFNITHDSAAWIAEREKLVL